MKLPFLNDLQGTIRRVWFYFIQTLRVISTFPNGIAEVARDSWLNDFQKLNMFWVCSLTGQTTEISPTAEPKLGWFGSEMKENSEPFPMHFICRFSSLVIFRLEIENFPSNYSQFFVKSKAKAHHLLGSSLQVSFRFFRSKFSFASPSFCLLFVFFFIIFPIQISSVRLNRKFLFLMFEKCFEISLIPFVHPNCKLFVKCLFALSLCRSSIISFDATVSLARLSTAFEHSIRFNQLYPHIWNYVERDDIHFASLCISPSLDVFSPDLSGSFSLYSIPKASPSFLSQFTF